jgi:hypothetical protein
MQLVLYFLAKAGMACASSGARREVSIAPQRILVAIMRMETRVNTVAISPIE